MTAMMIEAAVRGLLLAIVVGAGLRVLRVTNVPARKAAWSLVLVASLAMPFLMRWLAVTGVAKGIAWVVPIHRTTQLKTEVAQPLSVAAPLTTGRANLSSIGLPNAVAPHQKRTQTLAIPMAHQAAKENQLPAEGAALAVPIPSVVSVTDSSAARQPWHWPPMARLISMIYLAVSGALLFRLLWGLGAAVWLWSRADEISPLEVPEENVRVSARIPSPVTIGSGIVLPANYREWDRAKLRVVLAHEGSHVRQMDFYLQLLAGLYTVLFWFSPLGWWLKRTLSHLGEAISDRAGLEAAPSRSDYAGVLLEFAATTRRALPGVAMARQGNLSWRVDQMLNENLFRKAFAEGRRRAMVSLLLVPAALFAVTALVRVPAVAAQDVPPPPPASDVPTPPAAPGSMQDQPAAPAAVPAAALAPAVQDQAVPPPPPGSAMPAPQAPAAGEPTPAAAANPDQQPSPASPAVAPEPPDAAWPMTPDAGPSAQTWVQIQKMPEMKMVLPKVPEMLNDELPQLLAMDSARSGFRLMAPGDGMYLIPDGGMHGYAYYFSSNGDSWAIVDGAGKNFSMGSGTDKQQLDLAQRMAKGPFLWFSHDGKSYIVDDAAIVGRVQSLYAPMRDLARQQEALSVQQRVMARMDAEAARQQRTDANVRIPDLSKETADVEATLNSLKSQQGQMLSEQKLAEMQAKLAEMEARLGTLQARSAMQNGFGEKMRALGEQQRQMGEQQRQLGEQEKTLATQAQQQVQSLIQECLHNGKATQVK